MGNLVVVCPGRGEGLPDRVDPERIEIRRITSTHFDAGNGASHTCSLIRYGRDEDAPHVGDGLLVRRDTAFESLTQGLEGLFRDLGNPPLAQARRASP